MTSSKVWNYSNQWTITDLKNSEDFKATPVFSPVPLNDLTFSFEYQYCIQNPPEGKKSLFRLKFVKKQGTVISPTLQMQLDVTVNYKDGSLFKKFETMVIDNVQQMTDPYLEDVNSMFAKQCLNGMMEITNHNIKMFSGTLMIKSDLEFWDDFPKFSDRNEWNKFDKLEKFAEDFRSIYDPNVLSDVEFLVAEKSLPAHKAILAAHSPVFQKMFKNDFKEAMTNQITITDTTLEVFSSFLKFLYTCEVDNQSWSHVKELYVVADKYDVSTLKNECQQIISSLLSTDVICEILLLAFEYDDSQLKAKAVQYTASFIRDILPKEEWKEIVLSHPLIVYDVMVKCFPPE